MQSWFDGDASLAHKVYHFFATAQVRLQGSSANPTLHQLGDGGYKPAQQECTFFRSGWEGVPDLLRFLTYNAEFDMRGCDVVRSRFCPQQELCLHVRCADRLIEVNAKLLETFGFCRGRRGRVGAV